jgi:5S rRNA maturation endonuclease (ribonuclease M5)
MTALRIDAQDVKDRLTCGDVLSRHGITWTGADIKCPLPGHDDNRPSFGLFEDGKAFKCHGCGRGGDAIQLHRELTGQDFPTALEAMAGWVNLEPTGTTEKMGFGRVVQTYDYTDEAGTLLFQVCRMDPKDFRQRAPDGKWTTKGIRRVLYRLPAVLDTVKQDRAVYLVEGEKDVHALETLGTCATCNPGGAGKWKPDFTEALRGADVVILADRDAPGREHAAKVAKALHGTAARVRIIELPDLNGKPVKDAADWCAAGGTLDELSALVEAAPDFTETEPLSNVSASNPKAPEAPDADGLPVLFIPDGHAATVADAAKQAARMLEGCGDTFNRGGLAMEAVNGALMPLSSPVLVGRMEPPLCRVFRIHKGKDGEIQTKPAMLTETSANRIIVHRAFRAGLPPLKYLSRCPVLLADKDGVRLVEGYDKSAGVLVQGWEDGPLPDMTQEEAATLLLDVLKDFCFQTPSDKARALALMLSPAFLAGDMLRGRAPVGFIEADASQAGKGFFVSLLGAFFNTEPASITQRKGGVGSLEESFSAAVVKAAPIVYLDNLRGKLDSPLLESATTESTFSARVPYGAPVDVDVSRLLLLATSNRAELSPDMANRTCAVRLRKQPPGYDFPKWAAGDLPSEIKANRARYLSAVLTIARAWVEAGRPQTNETRISGTFRAWCRPMDWICRNCFGLPPLLDGNEEAQTRAANPVLNWLRDIALAAKVAGILGAELQASDILDLIEAHELEPAIESKVGEAEETNRTLQLQAIGRHMRLAFKKTNHLEVDGFIIHRWEEPGVKKPRKVYRFTEAPDKVEAKEKKPPTPEPLPAPPVEDEPELFDKELAAYVESF